MAAGWRKIAAKKKRADFARDIRLYELYNASKLAGLKMYPKLRYEDLRHLDITYTWTRRQNGTIRTSVRSI